MTPFWNRLSTFDRRLPHSSFWFMYENVHSFSLDRTYPTSEKMKQKIVYLLISFIRLELFAVLLHIFRSPFVFNFGGCGLTYYDLRLTFSPLFHPPPQKKKMHETRRLLEAATALSLLLQNASIPHAFYGSVLTAVLATSPFSDASIFSNLSPIIFQPFSRAALGDFLYCRRWPEPRSPFPQNTRSSRRERRLHHHTLSLDEPVGVLWRLFT
jgi:hypothetical protein